MSSSWMGTLSPGPVAIYVFSAALGGSLSEHLGSRIFWYPWNVLQVELLKREREKPDRIYEEAIMVTIAGIAAGLRNTG